MVDVFILLVDQDHKSLQRGLVTCLILSVSGI
jgi:hypothetical protein